MEHQPLVKNCLQVSGTANLEDYRRFMFSDNKPQLLQYLGSAPPKLLSTISTSSRV
jgi:hypothetical protein